MKLETPYRDIEPKIDWGYCPECEAVSIEWHDEGPICPACGHLWDANGKDIGSWDENMGEPWEESRTKANFERKETEQREWVSSLIHRFCSTLPVGATNTPPGGHPMNPTPKAMVKSPSEKRQYAH